MTVSRLHLTFACGDYDRTRALEDGSVRLDGINLTYLRLPVEETFFRMLRHREFDIAEMSLSTYVATLDSDQPGIPEQIPTDVQPTAVVGVVFGAVLIAVLASLLPALRAARLHPVEALRYE